MIPEGFRKELYDHLGRRTLTKDQLSQLKMRLARKFKMASTPTDHDLLLHAPKDKSIRAQLRSKPVRTQSGVAVVAIMTKPRACEHGTCIMCPGGPDSVFGSVPQSYTGREPASMRAARNDYDAYLQVFNRLEQYLLLGHEPGKVELIIMGGTFPSYPTDYQYRFVAEALAAMNDFSLHFYEEGKLRESKFKEFFDLPGDIHDQARGEGVRERIRSLRERRRETSPDLHAYLAKEQQDNETARIRCVAMCVETKPDWCRTPHISRMLEQGTTRVELGVQCLDDDILHSINRGHTLEESTLSAAELKDHFLKVGFHMMPGLPGSTREKDIMMFKELFTNSDYRPDSLKVYPCLVIPGTALERLYNLGEFDPITIKQAAETIAEAKQYVPEYCRIMRVQRDIPSTRVLAGAKYTNLRQEVEKSLGDRSCRCLRCREPRDCAIDPDHIKLRSTTYDSSGGTEVFLSFEETEQDRILGYCRLRLPGPHGPPQVGPRTAGVRELHVFGRATRLGHEGGVQHRGLGRRLLAEAERVAQEDLEAQELLVISGIGVREYYKRLGYEPKGPYVAKILKNH